MKNTIVQTEEKTQMELEKELNRKKKYSSIIYAQFEEIKMIMGKLDFN